MKANRFTEQQMIGILPQAEAGAKATAWCRQRGMGEAIFYQWKAQYGGLQISDARRWCINPTKAFP
jgi:putative transposase